MKDATHQGIDLFLKVTMPNAVESLDGKTRGTIPVGSDVLYCGHLPGGCLSVRWQDMDWVIHPQATNIK